MESSASHAKRVDVVINIAPPPAYDVIVDLLCLDALSSFFWFGFILV